MSETVYVFTDFLSTCLIKDLSKADNLISH